MKEPTSYLCHNCSDILSVAGEACILVAEKNSDILHGRHKCLRDYKRPVTEQEREESGLILPEEWDFETDFYEVASDEARENFEKVHELPLWEILVRYEYTEEEYLVEHPEHRNLFERLGLESLETKIYILNKYGGKVPKSALVQIYEIFYGSETSNHIERMSSAVPCTLETDPLRRSK